MTFRFIKATPTIGQNTNQPKPSAQILLQTAQKRSRADDPHYSSSKRSRLVRTYCVALGPNLLILNLPTFESENSRLKTVTRQEPIRTLGFTSTKFPYNKPSLLLLLLLLLFIIIISFIIVTIVIFILVFPLPQSSKLLFSHCIPI